MLVMSLSLGSLSPLVDAGQIGFEQSSITASESSGTVTVKIIAERDSRDDGFQSCAVTGSISVDEGGTDATRNRDFEFADPTSFTVEIPGGGSEAVGAANNTEITLTVIDDVVGEGRETVTLVISDNLEFNEAACLSGISGSVTPNLGTARVAIAIEDDDPATNDPPALARTS